MYFLNVDAQFVKPSLGMLQLAYPQRFGIEEGLREGRISQGRGNRLDGWLLKDMEWRLEWKEGNMGETDNTKGHFRGHIEAYCSKVS